MVNVAVGKLGLQRNPHLTGSGLVFPGDDVPRREGAVHQAGGGQFGFDELLAALTEGYLTAFILPVSVLRRCSWWIGVGPWVCSRVIGRT